MTETLLSVCESTYFPLRLRIKEATRYQYRIALRDYSRFLGRMATIADLDDDRITMWMRKRLDDGLASRTVAERAGRIGTLWTWLAKRKLVDRWPTFEKPDSPESTPIALSEDELRAFFHSASKERGTIGGVPADLWCLSYFAFIWTTSERKTAALSVRIDWLDLRTGFCKIPADARKGGRKAAVYPLWPETIPLLQAVIAAGPKRALVWPWDKCAESYYTLYNRILRDAGIPVTRKHKTHALRVSHATWLKAMGGNPTEKLMHDDAATTRRSYLDPTKLPADGMKLFIPWKPTG